ncbi:hypothetical protein BIW11_01647 [Tropilaelaps mercedesae]|uniref:Uncharacterized protein n=1 Tax=Tropilaelaps mercedesae TaxID=418985 RepID=A0A1V9XAU4_9ACAR|nr:hypothetical protein BIW11_01647 [Tropilaelaps mercedesae]
MKCAIVLVLFVGAASAVHFGGYGVGYEGGYDGGHGHVEIFHAKIAKVSYVKIPVVSTHYVKKPVVSYVSKPVKSISYISKPVVSVHSIPVVLYGDGCGLGGGYGGEHGWW